MKSTEQFLNEIKTSDNYTPVEGRVELNITSFLQDKLDGISLKPMFANLDIDSTIGYKYVNGSRKITRDVFIKILVYLQYDLEGVQALLKQFEFPPLYAKNKRDAALIYCLHNKYTYLEIKTYLATHNIIQL